MSPKLVLLKEYVGELISIDSELLGLEKDQKSKEVTINSINDKVQKLYKKLSSLAAQIETLSKDIKDREILFKIENDALAQSQKRLKKCETELKRSQENYNSIKDIKE